MDNKKLLKRKRKNLFLIKKINGNNNSQNSEINNDKSKENNPQSLTNISKYVLEFLQQKKITTYNNIIKYIKNIFQFKNEDKALKNIQRRVYESINIMSAIGYIRKKKQKLEYIKKDSNNENKINKNEIKLEEPNNCKNGEKIKDKKKSKKCDLLEEKYKEKMEKLESLQKNLIKHYLILKFYEKYAVENNESEPEIKDMITNRKDINDDSKEKKLFFKIIKYDKSAKSKQLDKEKEKEKVIDLLKKYQPYEIIKRIMAPEMISKINKIENETKDTNNEEIINQNNEKDIVFKYLRNKKIFKEELIPKYNNV